MEQDEFTRTDPYADVTDTIESVRIVHLEVKKWVDYNPRKDIKTHRWFRMENSIFTDPTYYALRDDQKLLWLIILCDASKASDDGKCKLNLDYVQTLFKTKPDEISILKSLVLFEQEGWLTLRGRYVHERIRALHNRTVQDSTLQDTSNNLVSVNQVSPKVLKSTSGTKRKASTGPITTETWNAYCQAFEARYGTKPVRNKTISGQLAHFVRRLGKGDSPHVIAYYLTNNSQYYVSRGHSVGVALADAEKLHAEWKTQTQVTSTKSRVNDLNSFIDDEARKGLELFNQRQKEKEKHGRKQN